MKEAEAGPRNVRRVVNAKYERVIRHMTQASPKADTAWKTAFKLDVSSIVLDVPGFNGVYPS